MSVEERRETVMKREKKGREGVVYRTRGRRDRMAKREQQEEGEEERMMKIEKRKRENKRRKKYC